MPKKYFKIYPVKLNFYFTVAIILFAFFGTAKNAKAATYYAAPSGSGAACSTSSRCTLTYVLETRAQSGDTVIIGDGVYNQRLTSFPNGSAGAHTIIKAENDGGVIIRDGTVNGGTGVIYQYGMSYVQFEGLRIEHTGTTGELGSSITIDNTAHHNKFLRCAFTVTPCTASACQNRANVDISGNYNLLEDCWVWGGGRYNVIIFGGDNVSHGAQNILRRVVIRHDREYSGGYNPQAPFCNYQGKNNILQNVIILDSDQLSFYDSAPESYKGAILMEKVTSPDQTKPSPKRVAFEKFLTLA